MAAPTTTEPQAPPTRNVARLTLLLAALGFFLITLDILIVNVALTTIGRELGGSTSGLQWVIDAYTLLFASLLLFAGNLSDRIGSARSGPSAGASPASCSRPSPAPSLRRSAH